MHNVPLREDNDARGPGRRWVVPGLAVTSSARPGPWGAAGTVKGGSTALPCYPGLTAEMFCRYDSLCFASNRCVKELRSSSRTAAGDAAGG